MKIKKSFGPTLALLLVTLANCHSNRGPGGEILVETNLPSRARVLDQEESVARVLLYTSPYQSINLLRVSEPIRRHMHRFVEETVYVISGQGMLDLGTSQREIRAGDLVVIPRYTEHGFEPTGDEPTVVLSIFSPENEAADRIFIDLARD